MSLQGVAATGALNFGIRSDQLVTGGTLHLRMTYSPSLIQDLSHLRVSLNGQTVAAVTLTKADAGHEVERAIALDPRYFSDYNHVQLDLVAHYTTECEDPQHSSLWVKVSPDSDVTLSVRPLELRDDLALLPAPFFDQHDNRGLVLPIVMATHAPRGCGTCRRGRRLLVRRPGRLPRRAFPGELRHAAGPARAGVRDQRCAPRGPAPAGRAGPRP